MGRSVAYKEQLKNGSLFKYVVCEDCEDFLNGKCKANLEAGRNCSFVKR